MGGPLAALRAGHEAVGSECGRFFHIDASNLHRPWPRLLLGPDADLIGLALFKAAEHGPLDGDILQVIVRAPANPSAVHVPDLVQVELGLAAGCRWLPRNDDCPLIFLVKDEVMDLAGPLLLREQRFPGSDRHGRCCRWNKEVRPHNRRQLPSPRRPRSSYTHKREPQTVTVYAGSPDEKSEFEHGAVASSR